MKINLHENEHNFYFRLDAESVEDAAQLVRMGLQAHHTQTFFSGKEVNATVLLRKPAKRKQTSVQRGKF